VGVPVVRPGVVGGGGEGVVRWGGGPGGVKGLSGEGRASSWMVRLLPLVALLPPADRPNLLLHPNPQPLHPMPWGTLWALAPPWRPGAPPDCATDCVPE